MPELLILVTLISCNFVDVLAEKQFPRNRSVKKFDFLVLVILYFLPKMALWLDKHRPKKLSKLDFHKKQAEHLEKLVKAGDFPHLLVRVFFSGK